MEYRFFGVDFDRDVFNGVITSIAAVIIGFSYFYSYSFLSFFLMTIIFFILVFRFPMMSVLVLCMWELGFSDHFYFEFHTPIGNHDISELIFYMLLLTWIPRKLIRDKNVKFDMTSTILSKEMVFFIGLVVFATMLGFIRGYSLNNIRGQATPHFYYILFFIVIDIFKEKKQLKTLMRICLLSTAFLVCSSIVLYFIKPDLISHRSFVNLSVLQLLLGKTQVYSLLGLNFILGFLFFNNQKHRKIYLLLFVCFFYALVLTFNRTIFVTSIVVTFFAIYLIILGIEEGIFFRLVKVFSSLLILFICISIFSVFLPKAIIPEFLNMPTKLIQLLSKESFQGESMWYRKKEILLVLPIWCNSFSSFILGDGFGRVINVPYLTKAGYIASSLHGVLPQIIWKWGFLGVISVFWILYSFFYNGIKIYKNCRSPYFKSLLFGVLTSIFSLVIMSFTQNRFSSYKHTLVIAILFALLPITDKILFKNSNNNFGLN